MAVITLNIDDSVAPTALLAVCALDGLPPTIANAKIVLGNIINQTVADYQRRAFLPTTVNVT